MSDQINISYSYAHGVTGESSPSAKATGRSGLSDNRLYAFDECTVVPLPTGGVLLVNNRKPRQIAVSDDVAAALQHCRHFQTLEDHAQSLVRRIPELDGKTLGVLRVLDQMREAGVMVEAGELTAGFNLDTAAEITPAPSRAFINTCDRPEALQRLLSTLADDVDLDLHERFYVIDDSRHSGNAAKNRALVDAFNRRHVASINYFGLPEREQLVRGLIRELPEYAGEIRFLLDQHQWGDLKTYSIPRSLCQLLASDRRVLMIDDDVLLHAYEPPRSESGVAFMENEGEALFYPSNEAWLSVSKRRHEDPLAGHLRCLGRNVLDTLKELGMEDTAAIQLAGSEARLLRGLDNTSRVLLTQCGTYGDPGTANMSWALLLKGDTRQSLLAAPGGVRRALRNRICWLGWSRARLSRRGSMSGVTGLENTVFVPPYMPAGRGGDGLFGSMVEFLYPRSLALDYNWAVPHLPIEKREGRFEWQGDSGDINLLRNHIGKQLPPDTIGLPEQRLTSLVQVMRDLGGMSDEGLGAAFRTELAEQQVASASQVMEQLREMSADHSEWRQLLEARQKKIFQSLSRKEVTVTAKDYPDLKESALFDLVRNLTARFADAVEAWPRIRERAKVLVG
jgi:hypothetical protein